MKGQTERQTDRQTNRQTNQTTNGQSIRQTNCIQTNMYQCNSILLIIHYYQMTKIAYCPTPLSCGFIRPKLMLLIRNSSIPEEQMMFNLLQHNLVSSHLGAQAFLSSLNRVISNFRNISFAYCGRFSEKVVPNFIVMEIVKINVVFIIYM